MMKPSKLLLVLIIVGVTTNNIRILLSDIENCIKDGYMDENGKIS